MKIKINFTNANVNVQTDAGEDVYSYSAEKLDISINTEQAIKAFEEIVAQCAKTKAKIDAISE